MPPAQNAVDLMSDGTTDPAIIQRLKNELPRYGVHPGHAGDVEAVIDAVVLPSTG